MRGQVALEVAPGVFVDLSRETQKQLGLENIRLPIPYQPKRRRGKKRGPYKRHERKHSADAGGGQSRYFA
jgi:hypothetical protein